MDRDCHENHLSYCCTFSRCSPGEQEHLDQDLHYNIGLYNSTPKASSIHGVQSSKGGSSDNFVNRYGHTESKTTAASNHIFDLDRDYSALLRSGLYFCGSSAAESTNSYTQVVINSHRDPGAGAY